MIIGVAVWPGRAPPDLARRGASCGDDLLNDEREMLFQTQPQRQPTSITGSARRSTGHRPYAGSICPNGDEMAADT